MVVSDIRVIYSECKNEYCGCSSSIINYNPNVLPDLEALEKAISRRCAHCGVPLGIKSVKMRMLRKE